MGYVTWSSAFSFLDEPLSKAVSTLSSSMIGASTSTNVFSCNNGSGPAERAASPCTWHFLIWNSMKGSRAQKT